MGTWLNPGNSGFADIVSDRYVDKTGLIADVNEAISTPRKLICVSRPRRFGKSFAAQMLCAYYDRSCDSHSLFDGLMISSDPSYERHLNAYNVIYLDIASIVSVARDGDVVAFIERAITGELCSEYTDLRAGEALFITLNRAVEGSGVKFVIIIDEWDAPIREETKSTAAYLQFLRSLFKNSGVTAKLFAAVYMTGIMPITKIRTQSALSDFTEYTMLTPGPLAEYIGFTEEEVKSLCQEYRVDYDEMKRWYDGYRFRRVSSIYNPNSVMKAIQYDTFDSYWSKSSSADNLLDFIRWDVDGLRQAIIELMSGIEIHLDTAGYNNDMTYDSRDAALTMFVHLGYLSYDQQTGTVRIPNEEIRLEFARALRQTTNAETVKRVRESVELIVDTIQGNCEAVAEQIRKVHLETTNPLNANSENSLRAVIQVAYFAYKDYYVKLEELPTGLGYADIVYIPVKGKGVPALVVELKWNRSADCAIRQIKEKRYVDRIEGLGGEALLVGISYDRQSGAYECQIEPWFFE